MSRRRCTRPTVAPAGRASSSSRRTRRRPHGRRARRADRPRGHGRSSRRPTKRAAARRDGLGAPHRPAPIPPRRRSKRPCRARCPAVDRPPGTADRPAISLRGLTKATATRVAVDGLTIDVPAGVVAGFVGPNGAGKTTTMAMLLGLVTPTGGGGTVLAGRSTIPRAYLDGVGALIEGPAFYPALSGARTSPCSRHGRRPRRPRDPAACWTSSGSRRAATTASGLLVRHEAAPRDRGGAARQPAPADPRRADQRARSRRACTRCAASSPGSRAPTARCSSRRTSSPSSSRSATG